MITFRSRAGAIRARERSGTSVQRTLKAAPSVSAQLTEPSAIAWHIGRLEILRLALAIIFLVAVPARALCGTIVTIPGGSELRLKTLAPLTTQSARKGQPVPLEVDRDFVVDGMIIIPRGAEAGGTVAEVQHKGMFGRSGFLRIDADWVKLGNEKFPVSGMAVSVGASGKRATILTAVAVGVLSGFVTGGSAVIPPGTLLPAWIPRDTRIEIDQPPAKVVPQPQIKVVGTDQPSSPAAAGK